MKSFIPTVILCLVLHAVQAQLPVPLNLQSTYTKGSRTVSGEPGAHYWQNTASYNIQVRFDPATRLVSGSEIIAYVNNSPDTLNEVLFKLYPNLYQKGAQRDSRVQAADLTDGVKIEQLLVNGADRTPTGNPNGTNMLVGVGQLLPKDSLHFAVRFSYTLNEHSHIRTGQVDSGSFFIAYFFPRIAVYDDIDGWNRVPYTGTQEFYNDFCHFSASVTVPAGYVVWATGDLVNARSVLSGEICDRLSAAEKGDAVVAVIDSSDLRRGDVTAAHDNTWQFEADDVTDFVFATSNHYMWQASSLVVDPATQRRTRVDVAFNPRHGDFYDVMAFSRKTVDAMSYTFPKWAFPYAHETVFDGLDQMEYPMMVNDNPLSSKEASIELTDHEIFHTMFPFYMGVNETKYAWMDEGWATIGEWEISPLIDTSIRDDYGIGPYSGNAGTEADMPIMSLSTQLSGVAYFLNSYPKPGMGYLYVKEMLGDSLFLKGLHYYIREWHGRHPMPLDFFNCMNTGSGRNMNWFWKRWFYDNGFPDLAVKKVVQKNNLCAVSIKCVGTKPVPVYATVYFADGSREVVRRDVSCWEKTSSLELTFVATKKVTKVVLGDTHIPDSNAVDNVYEVKGLNRMLGKAGRYVWHSFVP